MNEIQLDADVTTPSHTENCVQLNTCGIYNVVALMVVNLCCHSWL